jgi:hypothetical protein
LTLIRPERPIGVRVIDVTHASGLSNLSVSTPSRLASPPQDTSGASRIAVLVRGTGSAFRLYGVRLIAANADHGGVASDGMLGAAPACEGQTDCDTGASGTTGGDGSDATTAGTFTADGYTPVDGTPGVRAGTDGRNGRRDPDAVRSDCNTGCGCSACITVTNGTVTAAAGSCGCAGKGGGAGKAGRGGGASVALLVAGASAAVDVKYSVLESGDGGNGSKGGVGGTGTEGTLGSAGATARCHRADCVGGCGTPSDCRYSDTGDLVQGPTGGNAGRGGNGGNGGSGAGGPSYALVTLVGARVVLDTSSQLFPGKGGLSGGRSAIAGASAASANFP